MSTPYSIVYFITPQQILTSLVTHKTWCVLGTVSLTKWLTSGSSLLQKASKHFTCSHKLKEDFRNFDEGESFIALFLFVCLRGEERQHIMETLCHVPEVAPWPRRRGRNMSHSKRERIWDTSLRSETLASCIIDQCMPRGG